MRSTKSHVKPTTLLPFSQVLASAIIGLTALSSACSSGGGDCERLADKNVECGDVPANRRDQMRKVELDYCTRNKSKPTYKASIECSKTDSCDEFNACQEEALTKVSSARAVASAGKSVPRINELLAAGKNIDAMKECGRGFGEYDLVPELKAACDTSFTAAFAGEKSSADLSMLKMSCTSAILFKDGMAKSEALKAGCLGMVDSMASSITIQRDSGSKFEILACFNYKEFVKNAAPEKLPAATLLCEEAQAAGEASKAINDAKAAADSKSFIMFPYACTQFTDRKEKLGESAWYAERSKDVARACYGELGKVVLADVSRSCSQGAKSVHTQAAAFKLGESDQALAALLKKTAAACSM
jgi:hypothetical protein